MRIELWSLAGKAPKLLKTVSTNADGRTGEPLLSAEEMKVGEYELIFYVGDYFGKESSASIQVPFLDRVPIRFGIDDPASSYHIPLLTSPWSYTTYRGS
jgi:5-hydroxyisourate hydrolase